MVSGSVLHRGRLVKLGLSSIAAVALLSKPTDALTLRLPVRAKTPSISAVVPRNIGLYDAGKALEVGNLDHLRFGFGEDLVFENSRTAALVSKAANTNPRHLSFISNETPQSLNLFTNVRGVSWKNIRVAPYQRVSLECNNGCLFLMKTRDGNPIKYKLDPGEHYKFESHLFGWEFLR
jgi:hypothetical protein